MNHVSSRKVRHVGPTDARIFFLGDAPGTTDDTLLTPFVGTSGDLFDTILGLFDIPRETVRIGNVLNYQPYKNEYKRAHNSWQLEESMMELKDYLKTSRHNVIVPMGERALEFLTGHEHLQKHRGSVYRMPSLPHSLIIPTWHPSAAAHNGTYRPMLMHDMKKIVELSMTDPRAYKEPEFNFIVDPDFYAIERILPTLLAAPQLAVDIESKKYTSFIRCIGFAWSATDAVCIYNDGQYPENPIGPIFKRVLQTILSSNVPKILHNGMFDEIILNENGIEINNFAYDTMIAQHVLQPELPIGLDFCTSIYTKINYYKDDGKESSDRLDRKKLGVYNCKDVVATWQTKDGQQAEFDDVTRRYYEYKFSQKDLAMHFSRSGMYVDIPRQEAIRARVQEKLDKDYTFFFGIQRLHGAKLFKVTQHEKVKDFLFRVLELPVKTTREGKETSGEDAIISLLATVEKKIQDLKTEKGKMPWLTKLATLKLILRIRGNEKLISSYINAKLSRDGRHRSWYKFWGTETGRWSASSWYDETGLNGQTIPREEV